MMRARRVAILLSCAALAFLAFPGHTQVAVDVEVGRDVGDGQVLYDTPYDPKQVSEVTFVAPAVAHPYFEIVVPMGDWTEGKSATFKKVVVNGVDCESFYAFKDGFAHVQSGWLTRESARADNVVLVARSLWHNGADVTIDVTIDAVGADDKPVTVEKQYKAKAPMQGGGPDGWRRYQSVVLHERAGLDRVQEPVEFSITARAEHGGDLSRELRVHQWSAEDNAFSPAPFQTFNHGRFPGTPPGTSNENYLQHPSQFIEAVALASVPANGQGLLLVFYDNPDAPPPPAGEHDLKVTGEALGARVENAHFIADLDDKSGQIASFTLKGRADNPVPELTNSLSAALHWNPDSFGDNGLWGHTFSWDPPERTVVTTRGPLLFRITNSGRMPGYTPQIWASVTYSFYAGLPYVKVTTSMEVRDPFHANAIRNGEIVLDSHLIDHFVWQEKNGTIKRMRTLHGPNWQDEWATRVDPDVPWLALTNEAKGYGAGAISVDLVSFNPHSGEANMHRPAYYLYYHHFWGVPLTYFTRGLVYPFSDYQRGPSITVRPGSTYVEKMALMPFYLHEDPDRYEDIVNASVALHNPLEQFWGR
ncbi:MAG: hypothetical protein KF886_22290 [Candidatus Hydrogenedentes bacterium]|nr:hypothetical protein [Candidatus Hydrogenedentota bacterium]